MGMVSGLCIYCKGSGGVRKRDMIGMVTLATCRRCNGVGRRLMKEGTGEHRISSQLAFAGDWPGITQHDNDRGWNRR